MTHDHAATLPPEKVAGFAIVPPKGVSARCLGTLTKGSSSPEADFEAFADQIAQQLGIAFGMTLHSGEAGAGEADRADTAEAKPVQRDAGIEEYDMKNMIAHLFHVRAGALRIAAVTESIAQKLGQDISQPETAARKPEPDTIPGFRAAHIPFSNSLGQRVRLHESDETGIITGRAEHTNAVDAYRIRYRAADGRQVEDWWPEDAFSAT